MSVFLVVDDHAAFRSALTRALRPFGEIVHAGSVAEAKDTLPRSRWSALFVDVTLPDGSGLDWLSYARDHGCNAPALVLTASHDPSTINRAFDLDARFLVKPGDWGHIEAFVRRALAADERVEDVVAIWARKYGLSATETDILLATAKGTPRDQLASERDIALATFKRHVGNLLGKTGDASLMRAAARLLREVSSR